ncbi:reverse gyrase [Aeropyrum pernix K1]|uniref:Reverse gyrase 2 n=1 Tax=Aeropyrum pernix (strain ATCC 700893 / DSM 11879 / JCM 9820 / NBRC 100138 / K1) TaxID=272557 RepID=RGYR2_AERPE|nr:reverse gyrase [Aeropyrum pernix]Q9YC75.2 RecName: Full=Reverse gyrase 2 [Aeropyrum pernix K1]BAA80373.2 reverse gyrase [Aeropyrum pernix K1]
MPGGVNAVYMGLCYNCGGNIDEDRLEKGLPCARCLPSPPRRATPLTVYRALKKAGTLGAYSWEYLSIREVERFEAYFAAKSGSRLWSAQRSWAKRLVKGDSFAIIAPTGVGKSTLLTVYAAYVAAVKRGRVLYLVPTENLVRQVYAKLDQVEPGIATAYYSRMPAKARESSLEKIASGGARLIVATTGFLSRRFDLLHPQYKFDLAIVDDVDSLLRNSRNVERILLLTGFSEETVEAAHSLVKARLKLYRALHSGASESIVSRLEQEIAQLEARLRLSLSEASPGQLVIASATGRPRGVKHLLFKELLGFEVGGGSDYLRNIVDAYVVDSDPVGRTAEIVSALGDGVIVFVSQRLGKDVARAIAGRLEGMGVSTALALTGARRPVEAFARGEARVLIGMASRYGVIVRGLDLPERSKYAVFLGAPSAKTHLLEALYSPRRMLAFLSIAQEKGVEWAGEAFRRLSRLLEKVIDTSIVSLAARGKLEAQGPAGEAAGIISETAPRLVDWLVAEARLQGGLLRVGGLVVDARGPIPYLVVPDAPTYIQASGRVSRLYRGVMTRGLSIVVDEAPEYVEALGERLKWTTSSRLRPLSEVDMEKLRREIEESRRGKGRRVRVKTTLLVVESPTKARTIAWFWGRPGKRRIGRSVIYEASVSDPETGDVHILQITSTRGHLTDLTTDSVGSKYGVDEDGGGYRAYYSTIKRCLDCGAQHTSSSPFCPRCGSPRQVDSKSVVEILRKLASEVDEIVIATDPDREGEKIAWDVFLAVRPYNPNVRRGRFHEVTPRAVIEALRSGESVEKSLIEAQKVRRIVDRWIGFHLSTHLKLKFSKPWLGAGRVQTPVLGWIVDRYREWQDTRGYLVIFKLSSGGRTSYFTQNRLEVENLKRVEWLEVVDIAGKTEERNPPPPYTTDEYLYDASRKLGLSAGLAMKIAQDLFESGLITYHRTDSTRVSPTGVKLALEYLASRGLEGEAQPRGWGEGGAHEAIRPVRPIDAQDLERAVLSGSIRIPIRLTRLHIRVYDMIFRRFIASQMKPATLDIVEATLQAGETVFNHAGVARVRGGYALVNPPRVEEWLARLSPGDRIDVEDVLVVKSSLKRLYRAGDIVKMMREHGIGRPSTYAKAIEQNRRHGYVIESKKMRYLIPTKTGVSIYDYLSNGFKKLVSVDTTRRLEEALERVEKGVEKPEAVLASVWRMVDEAVSLHAATGDVMGQSEA